MALRRKLIFVLLAMLALVVFPGAIRKVATITSEPSGAGVWINGVYRGKTPVEIPYNWNWYYDFTLKKDGFRDYCVRERFYAPARHWIPFDLVTEAVPVKSRESQWRHYQLVPKVED